VAASVGASSGSGVGPTPAQSSAPPPSAPPAHHQLPTPPFTHTHQSQTQQPPLTLPSAHTRAGHHPISYSYSHPAPAVVAPVPTTTLNPSSRAALQGSLALLAAQLADIAGAGTSGGASSVGGVVVAS
jgi:hypothetical protein